jgi:signal transduction histidine kinase
MKADAESSPVKSKLARLARTLEKNRRRDVSGKSEPDSHSAADIAVRDRENMLAIVSHDLKNPLGAIQLNHQLMARTLQSGEPTERDRKLLTQLARAQRSAERMVRLIDDILDMAKIEAGRFMVEKADSRVDELLSEVLELHQPAAIQKSILLRTEIPQEACVGYFDHARIFQVLSNLMGNAIKFTPEGGTVTVRAETQGELLIFSVEDTGSGIAPEHLPHIFDRFYQAQETSKLGTGLGLSIAKGIVDAHHGKIWAESMLGKSSTFSFSLPVRARV